jgi:hypothetical protein
MKRLIIIAALLGVLAVATTARAGRGRRTDHREGPRGRDDRAAPPHRCPRAGRCRRRQGHRARWGELRLALPPSRRRRRDRIRHADAVLQLGPHMHPRRYCPGKASSSGPNHVHLARNEGHRPVILLVTYLGLKPEQPLLRQPDHCRVVAVDVGVDQLDLYSSDGHLQTVGQDRGRKKKRVDGRWSFELTAFDCRLETSEQLKCALGGNDFAVLEGGSPSDMVEMPVAEDDRQLAYAQVLKHAADMARPLDRDVGVVCPASNTRMSCIAGEPRATSTRPEPPPPTPTSSDAYTTSDDLTQARPARDDRSVQCGHELSGGSRPNAIVRGGAERREVPPSLPPSSGLRGRSGGRRPSSGACHVP